VDSTLILIAEALTRRCGIGFLTIQIMVDNKLTGNRWREEITAARGRRCNLSMKFDSSNLG
jgi:hypothetical protein